MHRIPAVIIQTPNSKRFEPLLETLTQSKIFEPILLPAIMGISLPQAGKSVTHVELKKYGRELSQNERACAISHSRARAIIATSEHGGLVLEDDARIIHLGNLEALVTEFLSRSKSSIRALGLVNYRTTHARNDSGVDQPRIYRLLAEAPLAVATVFTPSAANSLIQSAASTSQVADWPNSRCKFYITSLGPVIHGDAHSESVIGQTSMRVYSKRPRNLSFIRGSSHYRRLLQKIDTYLIGCYQGK